MPVMAGPVDWWRKFDGHVCGGGSSRLLFALSCIDPPTGSYAQFIAGGQFSNHRIVGVATHPDWVVSPVAAGIFTGHVKRRAVVGDWAHGYGLRLAREDCAEYRRRVYVKRGLSDPSFCRILGLAVPFSDAHYRYVGVVDPDFYWNRVGAAKVGRLTIA